MVLAPLVVLVCGNVLLNMWIDPVDTLRYHRLKTRTYSLPTLLAELERAPTSEADVEVFLLGTSRTRRGHHTREIPDVINFGISGADDRMTDNLLLGLLQTSTRPHVYFVDTLDARGHPDRQLLRHLFSGGTTKLSLRRIAEQIRTYFNPDALIIPSNIGAREPSATNRDFDQEKIEYLRHALPVGPRTRARIERRIQRMREITIRHDALVVFYDGPYSPMCLADPLILDALKARTQLWQQVISESNAAQLIATVDAERPRITAAYASYATPEVWRDPQAPEVWRSENWLDAVHFSPMIGQSLLDRLRIDVADRWLGETSP